MSGYEAQLAIVDQLTSAGVRATADPRNATPPCVLVTPPNRRYDLSCGWTATWEIWALVPGGVFNADAAKALDVLADDVAEVLPVERMTVTRYSLAPDADPLPAYRIEYDEGV